MTTDVPSVEPKPDAETLKVIFDLAKDAQQRQESDATALDGKAFPILTAGGVVLGLGGFSRTTADPNDVVTGALIAALVA